MLDNNCPSGQVQFPKCDSRMALQFSPRPYFKLFFCGPRLMDSLNSLKPRRRIDCCAAQPLNLISRIMLMRRIAFSWSNAVVLLAFSFAGCGGYSSTASVNGNVPVVPY